MYCLNGSNGFLSGPVDGSVGLYTSRQFYTFNVWFHCRIIPAIVRNLNKRILSDSLVVHSTQTLLTDLVSRTSAWGRPSIFRWKLFTLPSQLLIARGLIAAHCLLANAHVNRFKLLNTERRRLISRTKKGNRTYSCVDPVQKTNTVVLCCVLRPTYWPYSILDGENMVYYHSLEITSIEDRYLTSHHRLTLLFFVPFRYVKLWC